MIERTENTLTQLIFKSNQNKIKNGHFKFCTARQNRSSEKY